MSAGMGKFCDEWGGKWEDVSVEEETVRRLGMGE